MDYTTGSFDAICAATRAAGNGAVRAFFLNYVEFITLPLAAGIGEFDHRRHWVPSIALGRSFGLAFSITMLLVWLILELERRRVPAQVWISSYFPTAAFVRYPTRYSSLSLLPSG